MTATLQKKIRITEQRWERLEAEAAARDTSPNRLLVELAFEALQRRQWPRTEAEIHLLRSSMFAAQAIARDMIEQGREDEVQQIRRDISALAPLTEAPST